MLKKRSACRRRPRRRARPTTNKGIYFTTNVNTEVKKLFVAVAIAGLFTSLAPISVADLGYDSSRGMVFDAKGNLLVANPEAGKIEKFTPDGHCNTFASGLVHPFGLAFDGGGNLFVADVQSDGKSGLILKFSPDGSRTTFASGLVHPLGVAFDSSGYLFVVDSYGSDSTESILKFAPDGTKSVFFTTITTKLGSTRLVNSAGPAIDKAGNLFVSDKSSGTGRILKFTPDGTSSTFAAGLGGPQVLVFDRAGNLYVSSEEAEITGVRTQILKFAPDGSKSTLATAPQPIGLTFDGAGNLFVFDAQSRSILKFTPDGTKSTFAWDVSSTSPDKKWEFVGGEEPKILDAATNQVVLEISEGRGGVVWAPDSKRFGFNYYLHGSHRYSFRSVAFYELRGEKWEELGSPAHDLSEDSQLVQLLKGHLPQKFNTRDCSSNTDVLDLREWTDASTAILYAPCYRRKSEKVRTAFLFTLKFDAAGKSKIVKTHQMSEKEVAKIEKGE
jgi:sugar lactone lactonase YvrE